LWHTEKGAPLVLFAWPDEQQQKNLYALEVPKASSLILTHQMDGEVKGLADFAPDTPPVKPLFFGFRLMVGMGGAMLLMSWFGVWLLWRRGEFPKFMLRAFSAFTFAGWVATLAGWIVTEMGRQPWLVTGLLRTKDAIGPATQGVLLTSLIAYALTYAGLLLAYIVVLTHLAGKGASVSAAAPQAPVGVTL
jgi:cytochrome d ubiquinol oxidase subunit I